MKKLFVLALMLCLLAVPTLSRADSAELDFDEIASTDMYGEDFEFALEGGVPDGDETLSLLELNDEVEVPQISERELCELDLAELDEGFLAFDNSNGIPIDAAHFPDEYFRDRIKSRYDTNSDGALSDTEIKAVTKMDFQNTPVEKLTGIEYFYALEYLQCNFCTKLTELDVSTCKALKYLHCFGSPVTSLKVSNCKTLVVLNCYSNYLESLNLSGCTALENLNCNRNRLHDLDVSRCPALKYLLCEQNQLTDLKVSGLAGLTHIICRHNQLPSLDLKGCTALEVLDCIKNELSDIYIEDIPCLLTAYEKAEPSEYDDHITYQYYLPDHTVYSLVCDLSTRIHVGLKLAAKETDLMEGEKFQLVAEDSDVKASSCTFTSSKVAVVTVDSDGFARGVSEGSSTITARVKKTGQKCTCKITVLPGPDKITLDKDKVTLGAGETVSLWYTLEPSGCSTEVSWKSSDDSVASVDNEGEVTALKPGKSDKPVTITARTLNGHTATCKVTVKKAPEKVVLYRAGKALKQGVTLKLGVGDSLSFKATLPEGCASVNPFEWTLDGGKYIGMSTEGWTPDLSKPKDKNSTCEITAIKPGTATITVEAGPLKKKANGTVKIKVLPAPESVSLNSKTLALIVGESHTLKAELPKGTLSTLSWSSSNTNIATVNAQGKVTAKKKGSATITVTTSNGKTAECKVTVAAESAQATLSQDSATLGVGETLTLKAKLPKGSGSGLEWTSSNENVATVSKKGLVKAVGTGSAKISAKPSKGKAVTCTVEVKKAPDKVTLKKTELNMDVGGMYKLKATLPSKTASRLKWTSSDPNVAKVDDDGNVTALGQGSVTIKVETFNGHSHSCAIQVSNPVKYRALLISIKDNEKGNPFYKSVDSMKKMLETVEGAEGGLYRIVQKKNKITSAEGVHDAIREAFADADSNDVSLFFIATHGKQEALGKYNKGALQIKGESDLLPLSKLAGWLSGVPGKVVVIISSCYSGTAIFSNTGGEKSEKAIKRACRTFDEAVVEAFAETDPGVAVDGIEIPGSEAETQTNHGEFRITNKFYVLTETDYDELGNTNKLNGNWFVRWLTEGIGSKRKMPADTQPKKGDGVVTLNELYNYIKKAGDDYQKKQPFKDENGNVIYQHVKVFPENSSFRLFKR